MTNGDKFGDEIHLGRNDDHDGPKCGACGFEHDWNDFGYRLEGTSGVGHACPRCGFRYPLPPVDEWDLDRVVDQEDRPRYQLPREEAIRRIPALNLIEDDDVREQTLGVTRLAPAYFWLKPASSSGYHNPICRETRGLWAHTLMVSTAVERLAPSFVQQGRLDEDDVDLARSAAILHDQRKNGPHESPSRKSVSDHDLQMAEVVRKDTRLDDRVADAIASHMGPWYDGPSPSSALDHLVHNADMMASTANVTAKVPGPVPPVLKEIGVEEGEF